LLQIFHRAWPKTDKISPRRIRVIWSPWTWVLDALCLEIVYALHPGCPSCVQTGRYSI